MSWVRLEDYSDQGVVDYRVYDFNEDEAFPDHEVPQGFYRHFRELLTGKWTFDADHKYVHITSLENPDAIIVFRTVFVPSALIVAARFCHEAARRSGMTDVYHIANLPSDMIPMLPTM